MSIYHFAYPLRGLQYQTVYFLYRLLSSYLSQICVHKGMLSIAAMVTVIKSETPFLIALCS
jgi:hypothetical protein